MSNGGKNTILQMDVVMEERAESKVQTEAEVKVSTTVGTCDCSA
jgi:hypothetical protein